MANHLHLHSHPSNGVSLCRKIVTTPGENYDQSDDEHNQRGHRVLKSVQPNCVHILIQIGPLVFLQLSAPVVLMTVPMAVLVRHPARVGLLKTFFLILVGMLVVGILTSMRMSGVSMTVGVPHASHVDF